MNHAYSVPSSCGVDRSRNLVSTLLACGINALPAILFLIVMPLLSSEENYRVLFELVGSAFLAVSFLFVSTVCCRADGSWTRDKLFQGFAMSTSLAWVAAMAVLACLAMTPLYLGQDNGDGTNGIAEGILMVILFTCTFTPLILVLGALASFAASRLYTASASLGNPSQFSSAGASLMILLLSMLTGCDDDRGLKSDIVRHFQREGIRIEPIEVHVSAWSRAGYVVINHAPEEIAKIVDRFQLAAIKPDSDQERGLKIKLTDDSAPKFNSWVEAWGLSDRPKEFKLQHGGQFEYFYVVVTKDGLVYLFAEYAYG